MVAFNGLAAVLMPVPVPQILPHEAKACQSTEAKPSYSPVDPSTHWQHYSVCLSLLLNRIALVTVSSLAEE